MEKRPNGRPKIGVEVDPVLLRKIRKEKGFKQIEVAAFIGYTPARVTQFEAGHPGGVPFEALKKIDELFDVDYKMFMIDEEETNE